MSVLNKANFIRNLLVALLGVLVGIALTVLAWKTLYSGAESVAIIDIGSARYEDNRFRFPRIVDYLESEDFSEKVAAVSKLPALISALPAKRFGGNGSMIVRELREDNQIEMRVKLGTPQLSKLALETAVRVLMTELQNAKIRPASSEESYTFIRQIQKAQSIEDDLLNIITENLRRSTNGDEFDYASINSLVLLRDSLRQDRSAYLQAIGSLRDLFEVPTRPTVIVSPTPARSILMSPVLMIALGGLSGLIVSLFLLVAMRNRVADESRVLIAERDGP